MRRWRQGIAGLLMLTGIGMLARGIDYGVRRGLGWQPIVQALVVGALVFALGFVRWRYWHQFKEEEK